MLTERQDLITGAGTGIGAVIAQQGCSFPPCRRLQEKLQAQAEALGTQLPKEAAKSALWLCGAGSSSINGQPVAVEGGELAG